MVSIAWMHIYLKYILEGQTLLFKCFCQLGPSLGILGHGETFDIRGAVKKTNSIFTDIVQIGGREVNPISKKRKEMIF